MTAVKASSIASKLAALGLLAVVAGCATGGGEAAIKVGTEVVTGLTAGLPGLNWQARVAGVAKREAMVEALVESEKFSERLLFPATEPCRGMLQAGTEVRYSRAGNFGQIQSGAQTCSAVGSFELEQMRSRGGSSGGVSGAARPRVQADYRVLGTDEKFIYLRGRFTLAGALGVPSAQDLEVLIPNADPCRTLETRTTASLEYRNRKAPLVLLTSSGECAIAAVALPSRQAPSP